MNDSKFESPSLQDGGREAPSHEVKFLLPPATAAAIENRLRGVLSHDPFSDPVQGFGYATTTIYFDSRELDLFHRRGNAGRCKFRVRRYGGSDVAFVERKIKRGSRVRKRRNPMSLGEIASLRQLPPQHPAEWFTRQLSIRVLQPICRISYRRNAFVGFEGTEPIRATFDRDIVGFESAEATFEARGEGIPISLGGVIAEFKFRRAMPTLFKRLVEDFGLAPAAASKYRTCIETLGIACRRRTACA